MNLEDRPIGFFDSGVGGISVLKEAIRVLPGENFTYFGDSKNAPYGTRSVDEVKFLTFNAVDFLMKKGIKALVIACNTATSAAIIDLRDKYSAIMPVIGIEPALKPAVEYNRSGKIIIMATPMTLAEAKFNNLMENYKDKAEIVPLPCPGLVELIEDGVIYGETIDRYLEDKINFFKEQGIAAIVLGCTHYPFIKKSLSRILENKVPIIDGSKGTVRQLKRQLIEYNIISKRKECGKVEINNSLINNEIISLSYKLLNPNE
ncbi:glutamate racemase [Clostridiaceae bacterium UIB06]|uniref:Glutamate racemase n=1 Tax=Clostridium thailandense TaxID=2794346 RepID=A0A949TTU5_9CLOT|nr:glutamate racemase [Clostridium thailandense]MBV7273296.1 glutamate racemase [Clostridium thailandense]MCH5137321.1 glutamate racemase [Clostridiaceae bacterium UIB06]